MFRTKHGNLCLGMEKWPKTNLEKALKINNKPRVLVLSSVAYLYIVWGRLKHSKSISDIVSNIFIIQTNAVTASEVQ